MVVLGLAGILTLIRIVTAVNLHSAAGGKGPDVRSAYDAYSLWVGLEGLLVFVAAAVFIAWFFRAYKNLRRLGVEKMRYGTGWAIGSWFIPFFNWVRPKQIANDVWRGSERGADVATGWREVEVPRFVHWWWAFFLAQGIIGEIGQRMAGAGDDKLRSYEFSDAYSQIQSGTVVDVIGGLAGLIGVVLAIMLVSRISKRLDEIRGDVLATGLGGSSGPAGMVPANGQ